MDQNYRFWQTKSLANFYSQTCLLLGETVYQLFAFEDATIWSDGKIVCMWCDARARARELWHATINKIKIWNFSNRIHIYNQQWGLSSQKKTGPNETRQTESFILNTVNIEYESFVDTHNENNNVEIPVIAVQYKQIVDVHVQQTHEILSA